MAAGSLIGGKYRLTRKIGEGAMGVVWAAVNELTAREVAIKLISKSTADLRLRLLREAKACGSLTHRNIIEVLDLGQNDNGDPFLVMPLLQGETLAELLARQYRLDVPVAAQIGRDVARALAVAHAASIIHRDLKPANIFLHQEPGTEGLVVKVLDFGVSKNLSAQESMATIAGGVVGSPAYMSPEQIKVVRDIDHRTDIWSLGVVLFEMFCGRRPFQGESQEVIAKVLKGDVPRVSRFARNIDPALDALVMHCLQPDRDRRMRSAADLAKILSGYTGSNESSRIFAEAPQRGSSPPADPDATRRSQQASPASTRVGGGTERIQPDEHASVATRQELAPAPSSASAAESLLSNAKFAGKTMPMQKRPDFSRIGPTVAAPEPESPPQPSAPMAVTERLSPAQFTSWSPTPARREPGGNSMEAASAVPPGDAGNAALQGVDDAGGSHGSSPPALSRGGTVKILPGALPGSSPLPPAPEGGTTTSTAPLIGASGLSRPASTSAQIFGNVFGAAPEGVLSSLSPRARIAVLVAAAALMLSILGVGAYALVSSPASSPSAEPSAVPSAVPSNQPLPAVSRPAEIAPPEPTASATAEASSQPTANPASSRATAAPPTSIAPKQPAPPGSMFDFEPASKPTPLKPCGKLIKTNCRANAKGI
jgi:serine/threonine-protein kinase